MTKVELLAELCNNTYVMPKPSPIDGIGVFAVQDIVKGCREMFSKPAKHDNWILLSIADVQALPPHAKFMVENYCLYDNSTLSDIGN